MATTSKIPQEGPKDQSDSTDHHTDGTGVKTKRSSETGCRGADLRVFNDSDKFDLK